MIDYQFDTSWGFLPFFLFGNLNDMAASSNDDSFMVMQHEPAKLCGILENILLPHPQPSADNAFKLWREV